MEFFGTEISEKIYLPIIIILVALIIDVIINIILNNKIILNKKLSKHEIRSRQTLLILIKKLTKILIVAIAAISILQVFGINTTALVTGVSAITVVAGIVFQDILKDILVGASIIIERQFAIGEIVSINGFKGEVVSLSLKTTKLKSLTGETKIISNRNISEVTNFSLNDVVVKVIVSVSYEEDIKQVEKVLDNLIAKLNKEIEELKSDIIIEGIDSLSSSSVDFLLTAKSSAKNVYTLKRKILKAVKLEFDNKNIKIPYPQLEVHHDK